MKERVVQYLVCPDCQGEVDIISPTQVDRNGEIRDGKIQCRSCMLKFPITNYVPRFVPLNNYASSFGFQWNRHAKTQIDRFNGLTISRDRFYEETKWDERLYGERILEAGCGAGRFTQIASETAAEVFSFDYSNAVDACLENNGLVENLHIIQADIYRIPLKRNLFDKVFCFGVLQHCPDVEGAFLSLVPHLKSDGEIVVDVYGQSTWIFWGVKYKIRRLTKRLPYPFLYAVLRIVVPLFIPVKIWLSECSSRKGRKIGEAIPILNYKGVYPLSRKQISEWAILDTFDMLSAKYDSPQTIGSVEQWFDKANLVDVEVGYGPNGINAKGRKR